MTLRNEPDLLSRYLDGELTRDELPSALRDEADAFERLFDAVRERPVPLPPEVRAQIMDRVHRVAASPWRGAWTWLVAPRPIRVSPLTGALVTAAVVALIVLPRPAPDPAPAGAPTVAPTLATARFVFVAPGAQQVAVTGDFTGWDPAGVPMERVDGGMWTAEIAVEPGVHQYVFVVDGSEWRPDPEATQVDDGFGHKNSVLLVPAPHSS